MISLSFAVTYLVLMFIAVWYTWQFESESICPSLLKLASIKLINVLIVGELFRCLLIWVLLRRQVVNISPYKENFEVALNSTAYFNVNSVINLLFPIVALGIFNYCLSESNSRKKEAAIISIPIFFVIVLNSFI